MLILSQVLKKLLYLPFFTLISSFLGMGKLDGCIALFTLLASIAIVMLPSGFGAAKMFEIHRTHLLDVPLSHLACLCHLLLLVLDFVNGKVLSGLLLQLA